MNLFYVVIIYSIIINSIAIILMKIDKNRAIQGKWRIKEKTLLIFALLGGAIGIYIGMKAFKHKTRHLKFTIGIPFIIVLNIIVQYWIVRV